MSEITQTIDMDNIWRGRIDAEEDAALATRLHQVIHALPDAAPETQEDGIGIIGFCSDEGVRRNQGRVGAAEAPNLLRQALANLPWSPQYPVYDAGNIVCRAGDLDAAHRALADKVTAIVQRDLFPFVLGGGHEVAYGSWLGLANALSPANTSASSKPVIGIINFDAHFDLRTDSQGASSGTPFYQIAAECAARDLPFRYCCLGVSETANTAALFKRAADWDVCYRTDQQMSLLHLPETRSQLQQFMATCDALYLTIDLDVLPAWVAPGVSAPAAYGVSLEVIEVLLAEILATGKLALADIAEYNPLFDQDKQTARVAARLFYQLMRGHSNESTLK